MFHLFGTMEEGLTGKHSASEEAVKTAMTKWLKEQSTQFYEAGILVLIQEIKLHGKPYKERMHAKSG